MIRPILSLRKLTLDEAQGQVVYQYGKHSAETESADFYFLYIFVLCII